MEEQNKGAFERIIQTITTMVDHAHHGRPGLVTPAAHTLLGVNWTAAQKDKDGVVYTVQGKTKTKVGMVDAQGVVTSNGHIVGQFREAGLFPEVVTYLYNQVASVYKTDPEFLARWASWQHSQSNRDLKVILAAFLLVQGRKGDPIRDAQGKVAFADDDYRTIGEAMCLLRGNGDMNPKYILRVRDVLMLPGVAQINRDLGFSGSEKNAFLGRWPRMVERWLANRENNINLLKKAVEAGFSKTIRALARAVGYKPTSAEFFSVLRWKQVQSKGGHRTIAVGDVVKPAESLASMNEAQICAWIEKNRPSYKRLVGMVPASVGITQNILLTCVNANIFSDKDLIILTPTLEDFGLLTVSSVKERWQKAVDGAKDQRARTVLKNVKTAVAQEGLAQAAENAVRAAVQEIMNLRVYLIVDISGSMQTAIVEAKRYATLLLSGFPKERVHVSVFNTAGRLVTFKDSSQVGVEHAFQGIRADGGTVHAEGVRAFHQCPLQPGEDALFIFIGDEGEYGTFEGAFTNVGIKPSAFGLVRVGGGAQHCIQNTAVRLGVPCFMVSEDLFSDSYRVPEVLSNIMRATPVATVVEGNTASPPRKSFVEQILSTELLQLPEWAQA